MIRARLVAVSAVALLAASALAACSSSGSKSTGSGGSGGEFAVGFNSDLSGKYSANGVGQRDGFNAYFDYANSQGGINGHKVKVTNTDDASDVTRGTTNTTQLMTADHVSAIGGYILSNVCGAAAVLAKAHQVPIDCGSTSGDLMNPVQPYVFAMQISQSDEAGPISAMAKQLVAGKTKPRVAIIIYASAASVSLQQGLERYVKANGWDLVDNESVPLTATDVSTQAAKIVAAKPDVVMGALYDPLAVSFVRALKAANLSTPFVDYDGATYTGSAKVLQDPDFYTLSAFNPTGVGTGSFVTDLQAAAKLDGKTITAPYFIQGYIQALEIGSGLKTCGYPCTGVNLQKAMNTLNVNSDGLTSGSIQYSSTDHSAIHSASIYNWDATKSSVVAALSNSPGGDGTGS